MRGLGDGEGDAIPPINALFGSRVPEYVLVKGGMCFAHDAGMVRGSPKHTVNGNTVDDRAVVKELLKLRGLEGGTDHNAVAALIRDFVYGFRLSEALHEPSKAFSIAGFPAFVAPSEPVLVQDPKSAGKDVAYRGSWNVKLTHWERKFHSKGGRGYERGEYGPPVPDTPLVQWWEYNFVDYYVLALPHGGSDAGWQWGAYPVQGLSTIYVDEDEKNILPKAPG